MAESPIFLFYHTWIPLRIMRKEANIWLLWVTVDTVTEDKDENTYLTQFETV